MRTLPLLALCVALASCQSTPEQLTESFFNSCSRTGFMPGSAAFDNCMGNQWNAYYADRSLRSAQAAALLQSGAFAPRPVPPVIFQPAPAPVLRPTLNCMTTAGPNTGPFGVVTSNTTCY